MGAKISAHPMTVELEVNHSSVCVKGHDASMLFGSAVKLIVGCHRPLDVSKASMLHMHYGMPRLEAQTWPKLLWVLLLEGGMNHIVLMTSLCCLFPVLSSLTTFLRPRHQTQLCCLSLVLSTVTVPGLKMDLL